MKIITHVIGHILVRANRASLLNAADGLGTLARTPMLRSREIYKVTRNISKPQAFEI